MSDAVPLIDIRPDHWAIVREALARHVPQYAVWAFGSRAKWTAKAHSDLDLAIITDQPLSLAVSAALADDFSESDLPWKVDVVDWATISESFRKIIERDKVVVQEGSRNLGGLESDWKAVPLSQLTSTPPTYGVVQPGQHTADGLPMLRVNNFLEHSLKLSEVMRIAPEIEAKYRRTRIQTGDVLLTIVGSVGQVAVVPGELSGWNIARAIAMIRPNKPELSRWISLVLRSPQAQYQLGVAANTTVQTTINLKDLRELRIPLPDDSEREAIAHILGTLDDKIELNRRRNQTLEAMARALFKDWFVDFGPVRAKMEGPEPYLPADLWQLFPDRLDDEGKPEGWVYLSVGEFAELKGGKQLEKEKIAPSGPIPVFGGAGVMGYTDSHNADGFVIAVGRVGAYCGQFFSHRGKAWINNNASLIKQTDDGLAEWLFLSLSHADIDVIKKGAAQPFVSNGDIAKLPLMWPTEALVHAFTDIVGPVQKKKEQHDVESRALAQLRDTLLPKLISGELRIADAERLMEGTSA